MEWVAERVIAENVVFLQEHLASACNEQRFGSAGQCDFRGKRYPCIRLHAYFDRSTGKLLGLGQAGYHKDAGVATLLIAQKGVLEEKLAVAKIESFEHGSDDYNIRKRVQPVIINSIDRWNDQYGLKE